MGGLLYRAPRQGEREFVSHAILSLEGGTEFGDLEGGPFEFVLCSGLPGSDSQIVIATRSDLWPGAELELALTDEDLPSARVSGRVLLEGGAPWPNAPLALSSVGDELMSYVRTTTDEAARFSIGPLPAGRYALRLGADALAPPVAEFDLARGQGLELGELQSRD